MVMKIAHIASAWDVITQDSGARGRLIYSLAKKQQSEGHQVTVIAARSSYIPGCNMVHFVEPMKLQNNYILNWFLRRIVESQHYYKSFRWLGASYDIIHCHITEEGICLSFLAKSPCLVTLHGPVPTRFLPYMITQLYIIPHNTKLVACSKSGYLRQKKFYGDNLIGYVYNGIDTSMFPFISQPNKSHDIELCFIGRIVPEKGVHIAINVADKLHEIGRDVHLRIVGIPYPDRLKYFNKIVTMSRKRPYVSLKLNANTSEVARYVGNSDALLFPSLIEEAFGFVIIESMACGTPVLAFSRGPASEIIQNGINGFLCNSIDDMVNAILNINKINRRYCRNIVENKFSIDQTYKEYLCMYNKVRESRINY
jgi:glycosyltransferase involved in cell wall biosynthesis